MKVLLCLLSISLCVAPTFGQCPFSGGSAWYPNCETGELENYAFDELFCIELDPIYRTTPGYPKSTYGSWALLAEDRTNNWKDNPCCCKKDQNCEPLPTLKCSVEYTHIDGWEGSVSVTWGTGGSAGMSASIGVGLTLEVGGTVNTSISSTGSGSWNNQVSVTKKAEADVLQCKDYELEIYKRDIKYESKADKYAVHRCYYGITVEDCQNPGNPYQIPYFACDTEIFSGECGSAENNAFGFYTNPVVYSHTCN